MGLRLFSYFLTVPNKFKSGLAHNQIGIGFEFLWFRTPVSAALAAERGKAIGGAAPGWT